MNLIPQYDTKLFSDFYETVNDFCYDYQHVGIPTTISVDNAMTLYYLLYAKYGNSPIANFDETQFKYKLFSTIFMYGPAWEKRLDIQDKIRQLSADDLLQGAKAVHNHALNPETEPSTDSPEELTYINEQNTTNYTKSKMDAYGQLWSLISTDVTAEFLAKFNDCFKKFVKPANPLIYVTDEE